jgi:hypothetical protein
MVEDIAFMRWTKRWAPAENPMVESLRIGSIFASD